MVFDEEELEALLESVLVHIELYLHPERSMERWAVSKTELSITRRGVDKEMLQVADGWRHLFYCKKKQEQKKGGLGGKQ